MPATKIEISQITKVAEAGAGDFAFILRSGLASLLPLSNLSGVTPSLRVPCDDNGLAYQIGVLAMEDGPMIAEPVPVYGTGQTLVVACPDDGLTYQIKVMLMDGRPAYTLVAIEGAIAQTLTIPANNKTYQIAITLTDGQPRLTLTEL